MKMLQGFAVINDTVGKKIAFTYSELNESGTITKSNIKESFVVLDNEVKNAIQIIENVINARLIE